MNRLKNADKVECGACADTVPKVSAVAAGWKLVMNTHYDVSIRQVILVHEWQCASCAPGTHSENAPGNDASGGVDPPIEMTYPGAPQTPVLCRSAQECLDVLKAFAGADNYMDILQMTVQGTLSSMMEVVADGRDGHGALKYFGPDGTWASKGASTAYETLEFNYFGTPHTYPTNALISLDEVAAAVREFFESAGGRPTSVDWTTTHPTSTCEK